MDESFVDLRRSIYATEDEFHWFRQLLVNTVIATDIFDKELKALHNAHWEKAFSSTTTETDYGELLLNKKATVVIEHLIQASDISHTMQHWHIYIKWNTRLFEEMYQAYLGGRADRDPSGE